MLSIAHNYRASRRQEWRPKRSRTIIQFKHRGCYPPPSDVKIRANRESMLGGGISRGQSPVRRRGGPLAGDPTSPGIIQRMPTGKYFEVVWIKRTKTPHPTRNKRLCHIRYLKNNSIITLTFILCKKKKTWKKSRTLYQPQYVLIPIFIIT
jgi:hypothetical protein